jgi:hypothetical protein
LANDCTEKSQTPNPKKNQKSPGGENRAKLKFLTFGFFGVWTLVFVICAGNPL